MLIKNKPTKLLRWYVNYTCNLSCDYCISVEMRSKHPGVTKINIPKLKNFLNEPTKDIYLFFFTGGGEPMLCPNIVEACKEITKNHYVTIVTNLMAPNVKRFCKEINPKKVKQIRASLHIEELKKKNLTDTFVKRFNQFKKSGFKIQARVVLHPDFLHKIKEYKQAFSSKGIKLHFDPFF